MPTVMKEVVIHTQLEKIFNYVNKPSNLPEIWPSFTAVQDEQLLSNGGYRFRWTYKMGGIPLKGKAQYTDILPNSWFTCKTYGAVDSSITWTFRSKDTLTRVLSISEMGHFINRTLCHDHWALASSLRPML